ncbi:MAG: Ig-like domain-containing protein, partial [Gemmatimonadetes bacterium]|nr:Ig-like domain-containing protein [Gemmatimonadota bacterium]
VVGSLLFATSCGESSGGPTTPDPTVAGTQVLEGVHLLLAGGDQQAGIAGKPLASPVTVRMLNVNDQPVAGATLGFSVLAGGGSVAPSQVSTDAAGNAQVQWTLGPSVGPQTLQVTGPGGTSLSVTATASPPVARVRVEPDSLVLGTGSTGTLHAVALDAQGNVLAGRTVAWTTSDAQVASLGAGGSVTGVAAGTATVTATVEGVAASAVVRVLPVPVATVRIQPDSLVLTQGSTGSFTAVALDAQGNALTGRAVTWTTSDAGVASLGAGGAVTGVAQGTARVTATVEGVTATAAVRVTPPPVVPVARVRIQPDSLVLVVGSTASFSAVALDAQGNVLTGRAVTWSLTNPQGGFGTFTVATLGVGGSVTAVAPGTAVVTAIVEGATTSTTVRVVPVPVAQLRVRPDSLDLLPGASADLNALALDAQGNLLSGRPVAWLSSDPSVATVGSNGTVVGRTDGTATITATVEGIAASATVRVRVPPPAPVAALRLQPDSMVLAPGAKGTFFAVATDAQGNTLTGRAVTWTTSDAGVAAFEGSGGVVTGVAEGTATVTATVEGITTTARVRVLGPAFARVAQLRVQPDSLVLAAGSTGGLAVVATDAQGNVLTGRPVTWISMNSQVATVGAGGTVTGVAKGTTQVRATVEGVTATATVRVFPVPVAQVRIQPDSLVLDIGGTGDFNAVALDAQGNTLTGRAVTWTTSSTQVATLGAGGSVTGVGEGTATVTATVEGVTTTAKVRVLPPPAVPTARVRIQPDSLVLTVGSTGDFDAVALDAQGNVLTGRKVTWTLTNPQGGFGTFTVATLGAGGSVTAVGVGTATVTATVEGVTATARVRVVPVPVAQVRVRPDSLDLLPGASADLNALALDAQGNLLTGRVITWTTSNPAVAPVGPTGTVAGLAEGTATITATVEGITASARVRVRVPPPAPVATLTLSPDSLSLVVGRQGTFFATAKDAQGNVLAGRTVTWTTSDARVIGFGTSTVGGLVTALAEGTATVTATSEGVSATATVRVRTPPPVVASVKVIPDTLSMIPGDSLQFRAVAYDTQGNVMTGLSVTWGTSSSYGTGAQVSRSGMVTAWSEGTTTIRATVPGGATGGVTGSATVRVRPAPLSNVKVTLIQKRVMTTGAYLDVSSSAKQLQFTVGLSEAAKSIALRIRSPQGMRIDCGPSDATNDFRKEFFCSLEIPAGADPGLWRVEQLVVNTTAGTRTFTSADLDAGNVPGRGFDVLGSGSDHDAPQVRTVVSHGRDSGKFWIQYSLVDHVTGVASSSAILRNVATGATATCQGNSSYGALARVGDHYCALDIPAGGQWQLVSITARDGAGNTATYTPAQIDVVRGVFEYTFLTYDFTS